MKSPKQLTDTVHYTFGDEVYHRTNPSAMGVVIGILFKPGFHQIQVQWTQEKWDYHYPFELSKEKSFIGE